MYKIKQNLLLRTSSPGRGNLAS